MPAIQPQLTNISQALPQLGVAELDSLMLQIIDLRKRKLPGVLNGKETKLLQAINRGVPTEIKERYDVLIGKKEKEDLTEDDYQELIELTAYMENHNVQRLKSLVELAKLRNVSLDDIIAQLELKPRAYVP